MQRYPKFTGLELIATDTLNGTLPVKEGYVYAEAVEVFNHHRIPFIEVRLVDEAGELIGVMTSSGYRKDAK